MGEHLLLKILWSVGTLATSISVMMMISIYRKIWISLSILTVCLNHIIVNKGSVVYEDDSNSDIAR